MTPIYMNYKVNINDEILNDKILLKNEIYNYKCNINFLNRNQEDQ